MAWTCTPHNPTGAVTSRSDLADLLAVAVDGRGLVVQHLLSEDGDHAGLAVGILARPVDVRVAEHRGPEPVLVRVGGAL